MLIVDRNQRQNVKTQILTGSLCKQTEYSPTVDVFLRSSAIIKTNKITDKTVQLQTAQKKQFYFIQIN